MKIEFCLKKLLNAKTSRHKKCQNVSKILKFDSKFQSKLISMNFNSIIFSQTKNRRNTSCGTEIGTEENKTVLSNRKVIGSARTRSLDEPTSNYFCFNCFHLFRRRLIQCFSTFLFIGGTLPLFMNNLAAPQALIYQWKDVKFINWRYP